MENFTTGQSLRTFTYSAPGLGSTGKTLARDLPQAKSLGQNAELSQWIEEANAYYQAVINGTEKMPAPARWNEFLTQLNWATGQLQPGWEPDTVSAPQIVSDDGVGESDPFGGRTGPLNNLVYNEEKARIGFTGNSQISDIWSDDVTIDVAPLSASVTSEITVDTRFHPAEEVLKIIVKDPATGTESVFMIHDRKDAKIRINTPKESQLTSKAPAVTWGHFEESTEAETTAVGIQNELGEWEYEAASTEANEFVNFKSRGGEDQSHVVWGNTRITAKPSDHVNVAKNADGGFTVTVTHKDKSSDVYRVHKGFKVVLQANQEYVSFAGGAEGEALPAEWADLVILNPESLNEEDPSSPKNPKPDATEPGETGHPGTAIYNKNPEVELTAFGDEQYETFRIYAPDTFTLHVSNYSDTVEVKPVGKAPFPAYIISVINEAGKAEDYMVYGPPESIVIDGLNVKLVDGAASDPTIQVAGRSDTDRAGTPLAKLKEVLDGKSDAQILNALKVSFPEIDSMEKLTAQMASGAFPPARPTRALLQFLWTVDEKFSGELNKAATWDHTIIGPAYKAATERLIELLKALYYPDHNVSAFQSGTANGYLDWQALNDFTFDGVRMSYTNESEGHTTELTDL